MPVKPFVKKKNCYLDDGKKLLEDIEEKTEAWNFNCYRAVIYYKKNVYIKQMWTRDTAQSVAITLIAMK